MVCLGRFCRGWKNSSTMGNTMSKLCAAGMLLVLGAMQAHAADTALMGATVIDGNGGAPIRDGVILISDGKIAAVGGRSAVQIPGDATRVDLSGKFVVPGLMDGNVHFVPWPSWTYIEFLARYENNFDGIAAEAAQIALKHGITTAFDSMGPARPLMAVRD